MELDKMIPRESRFYLRLAERGFTMNPVTLADEIWMQQQFGKEIENIFTEWRIGEIARIVFRLLDEDGKKYFAKRDVVIVNEAGDRKEEKLGGVVLLTSMISGWDEKKAIVDALLENIGLSRPEPSKDSGNESKKKEKR